MTLKILSNAREGEISYNISYMWNLKRNDTNKLTKQTEIHRLGEWTYGCLEEGWGKGLLAQNYENTWQTWQVEKITVAGSS